MPPRPTSRLTIALISALAVIPPALVFYVDARFSEPVVPGDAGAPDAFADAAREPSDASAQVDEVYEPPSWDDAFTDFQTELSRRCDVAPESSEPADVAMAQQRERACVELAVASALPRALAALPQDKRAPFAAFIRGLDPDLERLCVLAAERDQSDYVRGIRHADVDGSIEIYRTCQRTSRHGLLFLLERIAAKDVDTFVRHLEIADAIGQITKDTLDDLGARVGTGWDRGLRAGYLRPREEADAGAGVLGPRAWANLSVLVERANAAAPRFGQAVCDAWPALAAERDAECTDSLALAFFAQVTIEEPRGSTPIEPEDDLLGPSHAGGRRATLGYLTEAQRAQITWKPRLGEPLLRAEIEPVARALEAVVTTTFLAKVEAQPKHGRAWIQEQTLYTRQVDALCALDEEAFWRGPGVRYHGAGEGVVGALCRARAHALRLVELGAADVTFSTAIGDMAPDRSAVEAWFTAPPAPALPPPRAAGPIEQAHGRPLTAAEERAFVTGKAAALRGAEALAAAVCDARPAEERPPVADCKRTLRGHYLSYGAFSALAALRE